MQLGIYYYPHENEHMLINSKVPECIINAITKYKIEKIKTCLFDKEKKKKILFLYISTYKLRVIFIALKSKKKNHFHKPNNKHIWVSTCLHYPLSLWIHTLENLSQHIIALSTKLFICNFRSLTTLIHKCMLFVYMLYVVC